MISSKAVQPKARFVALATGVGLACSIPAARSGAQESARAVADARLAPGTWVKVGGHGLPVGPGPAAVVEQRGDTLVLRDADGALALVPLDRVTRLEVGQGQRSYGERAKRGARVGFAAVGGATLIASGVAFLSDHGRAPSDCYIFCIAPSVGYAVAGTVLTGVATLGGAVIGGLIPAERWTRVNPSNVRVGVAPRLGGGTTIAVGLRF